MSIYGNKLKVPTQTKTKVTLGNFDGGLGSGKDESVKNFNSAKYVFNFDISDGALKAGAGLQEYLIDGKTVFLEDGVYPKKFFYHKNYDVNSKSFKEVILCYASNGYLYTCNLFDSDKTFTKTSVSFLLEPTAVSYNYDGTNVLLLSSRSDGLLVFDGVNFTEVDGAPKFSSMCVHNERVFATENDESTSLWFSDDFDPSNWYVSIDEAGFIEFPDERGALLKVISFLDFVYIFREYGISRVLATGNQEDFSVSNLHSKLGRIYGESVTDCGNYVFFLSSNGIFRFNGVDAVKILDCYDAFLNGVDNASAHGVYNDGKYYLNLKMKIDKKEQNVLLVYNLFTNTSYIMKGCKISAICLFDGQSRELIATYNDGKRVAKIVDGYGKLFDKPLKKVWQSVESDFSLPCKKILYKLSINVLEEIEVVITCDNVKNYYKITPNKNYIEPKLKGKNFSVSIISYNNNPRIYKPTIYFKYLKEHLW